MCTPGVIDQCDGVGQDGVGQENSRDDPGHCQGEETVIVGGGGGHREEGQQAGGEGWRLKDEPGIRPLFHL